MAAQSENHKKRKNKHNRYLIPYRLEDVMSLIYALAVGKTAYRTNESLNDNLRNTPQSADNWFMVAEEHPEFFRFNKSRDNIILQIRFLKPLENESQSPKSLELNEAQKLIDYAIALHDKQLARQQRYGFLVPLGSALIGAIFSLVTIYFNNIFSTAPKFEKIYQMIDSTNQTLNSNFDKTYYMIDSINFRKSILYTDTLTSKQDTTGK